MNHLPHKSGAGFWRRCSLLAVIVFNAAVLDAGAVSGQVQQNIAGFITGIRANSVDGDVTYERGGGRFSLEAGQTLDSGDSLRSGVDSYAEFLLQPGNFLRLGGGSEFQIISDRSDRVKLKLTQGAISIETVAKEGDSNWYLKETQDQIHELIRVITPEAEVFITRPGIFRINVSAGGKTELIVREGEALINGRRIKEKRKAIAAADKVVITEIETKREDGFDSWSRERASRMVQANRSLKRVAPWSPRRNEVAETTVQLPNENVTTQTMVIFAKPGSVNFVEAGVELSRTGQVREPLTETSQLQAGDKVRTEPNSFAELTLLPDMYLRLKGGSAIALDQLTNDSISLKLLQGSAILDISRFEAKRFPSITIAGLTTSAVIADEGNYRLDVEANGDEITVRKGKVTFKEQSIGSCRKIGRGEILDCDKKSRDNFDFWSEHRGEGLVFNGRRTVTMVNHLARLRLNRFRNAGFWFQTSGESFYTFIPFYSLRFRSPYGGSYSTVLVRLIMNRHKPAPFGSSQTTQPQP